jgi:hypothetical protein
VLGFREDPEGPRPVLVLLAHAPPVREDRRQGLEIEATIDELTFFGNALDQFVQASFVPDRGHQHRTDVAATQRSGHVRGIDQNVVRQSECPFLHRPAELGRAFPSRLVSAEKIGPR